MPDLIGGDGGELAGEVAGLDILAVGDWLAAHCALRGPITVAPVAGGRSNLTSVVTDADGRQVVVRRPPLSGVLASAHDMVREARIIAALVGQDVPVPAVLGVEEDASVTGAPFFVMEHVAGAVLRTGGEASVLTSEARHEVSLAAVDTLVALHALDPDAIGLGDLARRDGYLERQLARWSAQLTAAATRALPDLLAVHERLVAALPEQRRLTLVHGDFRLDNLIVDVDRGSVAAVLDWELATLGDPLADLGLLLVYWGRPGTASGVLPDAPTALEGFAHPEELIARYAAGTGEDAGELAEALRPYIAFSLFKLACILEGVRVRTVAGAYGALGQGSAMGAEAERYLDLVPELARRGLAVLTAPDGLGEATAPLR